MKKKTIPFKLMPGSWGLSGRIYEEAEANYYYEGEELERRLAEIQYKDHPSSLRVELINIDHKHGKKTAYERDMAILVATDQDTIVKRAEIDMLHKKISKYEYQKIVVENNDDLTPNQKKCALLRVEYENDKISEYDYDTGIIQYKDLTEIEAKIEQLHVDYEHHKIEKTQFEKEVCTLQEKPWVGVIDQSVDLDKGVNGFYISLDWNEYWIEFLRLNGYTGISDESIVEQWFSDVNNSMQSEETVAIMPLARHMRNRDNGTIY